MGLSWLPVKAGHTREPARWLEDFYWHRISSSGSEFTWSELDVTRVFLRFARGRSEFDAPEHLASLAGQQQRLYAHFEPVALAAAEMLTRAQHELPPQDWPDARTMLNLDRVSASMAMWPAQVRPENVPAALEDPEVVAVMHGYAFPNPLSRAWELLQVLGMYEATIAVFEDMICDLATELQPDHGWISVAEHCSRGSGFTVTPSQMRQRVEGHHDDRGQPGDPRRQARQDHGPAPQAPPRPARRCVRPSGASHLARVTSS